MRKLSFCLSVFCGLLAISSLFTIPNSQVIAGWDCNHITIDYVTCESCHQATINVQNTPNEISYAEIRIEYNTQELTYFGYDVTGCLPETYGHLTSVTETESGILYAYTMDTTGQNPIPAGLTGCLFKLGFENLVAPDIPEICIVDLDSDVSAWCELPTCCHVNISPESRTVGSEETVQFTAESFYCSETSSYSWEVTSSIGSTIDANGLYTAGINNTSESIQDEVKVTDEGNNNVFDAATVTVSPPPCELTLTPKSQTVLSSETIQFSGSEDGGCNSPCYDWNVTSSIGSTIDVNGLYTAGSGTGTDTVTLTDPCNGDISDTATVTIALDSDDDRIPDSEDNCPDHPNGTNLGTCVKTKSNMIVSYREGGDFITCTSNSDCEATGGTCDMSQGDCNGNGIGDVCECYMDCNNAGAGDGKITGLDLEAVKDEYGRWDCSELDPCYADGNEDSKVTGADLSLLKNEYGRWDCPF